MLAFPVKVGPTYNGEEKQQRLWIVRFGFHDTTKEDVRAYQHVHDDKVSRRYKVEVEGKGRICSYYSVVCQLVVLCH
jgi:hypothetical protein